MRVKNVLFFFFFLAELTLKWFGVWCDNLQAAAQWNRGEERVWDEGGNRQQLNQLGYRRASATPKCVGGEAGKLLVLVEATSH